MTTGSIGTEGTNESPGQRDPVAAAIRIARSEMNVNQAEFAAMIGVKQPTVAQLENGRRKPSLALAYRLAQVSGQALEVFVEEHYEQQIG